MTCILKYLNILTFPCLWWGATEGSPFSKAVLHSPVPDLTCLVKFTILPKDLAVQFCFINDSTALQSRPFISTALTIIKSSSSLYLCLLVCFRLTPFVSTHYSSNISNMRCSVSSGDETLCRMFDISSQTKSFLKEKLRTQILSSVWSDFQTLIKH